MSAIVLSGGRILSIGGAAFGIGQSTPPPPTPSGTLYKTNFGHYMMTGGYEFGTGLTSGANYYYGTELQLWSTLGTNNVAGYAFMIPWWVLEDCTQTVNQNNPATLGQAGTQYAGFQYITQIMNAVQQASPGMSCIMYTKFAVLSSFSQSNITGTNWATSAKVPAYVTTCGGTLTMPTSYGSGTTMTGAVAPIYSGSSYYGFGFAAYSGNTSPASNEYFQVLQPDVHNPVVNQYIIQGLQALLQLPITLSYGPYAGETFTLDQHPQMTLIALNDEYSLNMGSSANFSTGITLNPRLTTGGAPSPTIANFNAGYRGMCAAWSAASEHTNLAVNISFGYTGSNADSTSTVPGYVNHNINTAGISNLPGIVMSSSDGTINQWGLNGWQYPEASWAWQGFIGIGNADGPSTGPLPTPTYPNLTGTMPTLWQVEAGDYNLNSGGSPQGPLGASVAACEQGIIPGANYVQANWICWALPDGVQFGTNAWTGALNGSNSQFTNYWNGSGVYSVLQSSAGLNSPSQLLVTNSMVAPQNFAAVTTTTTAILTWTPQTTNTGTGLAYHIYRNGSLIDTTANTSVSTYTDTGLSANTSYTYTINVYNSNGAGPQSTFTATTAVFSYTNFTSSNIGGGAGQIFLSANAALSGSAIALTPDNSNHTAGAAWYVTQQNIQAFTTKFTFRIIPSNSTPQVACAMTFAVQNSNATTNGNSYGPPYFVASADANVGGYGSYNPSIGANQQPVGNCMVVKFDTSGSAQVNYPAGIFPNSTGVYLDGGPYANMIHSEDLNPNGINLNLGNITTAIVVYDGSFLTMVLLDTVTLAQARYVWPLANLPAVMGTLGVPGNSSNIAWVGFTGGCPPNSDYAQEVLTWAYWTTSGSRLSTPVLSPTAGTYSSAQTVSISGPPGASIYYTTNGILPTSASTPYTTPFTVNVNTIVNAVAIQNGYTDSYVATADYTVGSSTPVINYPSGFAANDGMILCGRATLSGSAIQLTDTGVVGSSLLGEVGCAWYATPVSITSFTSSFQLQFTSATANGMTFCLQNRAQYSPLFVAANGGSYVSGGPFAMGNYGAALGYGYLSGNGGGSPPPGGILSSAAVSFNLTNNGLGFYSGGVVPSGSDVTITGVTLTGGNPLNVVVSYSGTTLAVSITDTVTTANFSHNFTSVNLSTLVGGSTAFAGFTAGTENGSEQANQFVNNWTMN
jgi:hypothetical protein